jgi:tetratricopeptide (TPR) repeat protein
MKKLLTTNITKNEKRMNEIEALYHQGDFADSLDKINHYLSLNPNDFNALLLRGKLLRMLKLNDEARSSFISLFPYLYTKEEKIKALIELIYLEIYERNYLIAYSYLKRLQKFNRPFYNSINIELANIYLLHQTGMKE